MIKFEHLPNLRSQLVIGLLLAGLLIVFVILGSLYLPVGVDWHLTFRPAALATLHGQSLYKASPLAPYAGAPWGVWMVVPLSLLPENIGRAILFLVSMAGFAFAAQRLGAKPLTLLAFLLSPPVIHCLLNANQDWMPLVGFVLPPQLGLFFILVKPQMGSVVALYWLIEAWRNNGWKEVLRVFSPVSLALGLSFLLYGLWPLNAMQIFQDSRTWNASLWPASIPVGLGLLWASLRKREIRYAMAASPCLSPYVLFHSWAGALVTLVTLPGEMLAAVVGLWILVIIQALALFG